MGHVQAAGPERRRQVDAHAHDRDAADADVGTIRFGDINVIAEPERLRRTFGYLPQDFGVYPRISAYDMLDHMAVLKGIAAAADRRATVETLLHRTNLWDVRKKALSSFSGGMRQRFGIAQALIGNPQLIIVDEPTAGFRQNSRQVGKARDSGTAVYPRPPHPRWSALVKSYRFDQY